MRGRRKCPPKLKIEERFEWFARSRQVGSCSVGRDISTPVITAGARQHETRRHEARQNARRQDDARRQRKDSGTGKFHGKVHATSGRATVYQEAEWKAGAEADELQDFERPGCARDPGGDEGRG